MRPRDEILQGLHAPPVIGVLHEGAEDARGEIHVRFGTALDPDVEVLGAALQHRPGLRKDTLGNEETVHPLLGRFPAARIEEHGHCLGRGGRFVEQAGIGQLHTRQVADDGLEIHQGFEPTLRDFRLIGGVCRVPSGVLHHVPADDTRHFGRVIAHPDVVAVQLVLRRDPIDVVEVGRLGHRLRHIEAFPRTDGGRHGTVDECSEGIHAHLGKHGAVFLLPGSKVTLDECS